ncbi:MAG: hypothetical protein PHV34_23030, partial [Verrucomicrobiae bacterium]|nr:hypothetical protein [Verrucomicrobiae bacterium]
MASLEENVKNLNGSSADRDYRATAPFNDLHRRILRVNAEILKNKQLDDLSLWHKNRWEPLAPTEIPASSPGLMPRPVIDLEMMNHEYRSAAFNVTNTLKEDVIANIGFKDMPGGMTPEFITLHQVEFVGTEEQNIVADPLPIAPKTATGFKIAIPSGMTRQIWMTFAPEKIKPGDYKATIIIANNQNSREVKFLRVPSFQGVTRQDFGMAIGSPTSENLLGRLFCTGNEFRMP